MVQEVIRSRLVLLPLLFLSACTQIVEPDKPPQKQTWEQHQKQLGKIVNWELNGRVSIRSGKDAWSGSLYWLQNRDRYDLRILAPLGMGSLHLKGSAAGVVLKHSGEEASFSSRDPELLLSRKFGWYIPVKSLRYWVKGLPDPRFGKAGQLKLDTYGRVAEMQQAGWQIRFLRYQSVKNIQLPGKVFLNHNGLGVRMIIREWDLKG